MISRRYIYRAGNRQLGLLLLAFGLLALARVVLGVPRTAAVSHPIADKVSLFSAAATTLTGLALWRGYLWVRWVALAWWLLGVGQVLLIIHGRGAADLNTVGVVLVVGILSAVGFVVRHIWRYGPHVQG